MRLSSNSSPTLVRYAFREARAFLALLLIGGPALYSVEAYFTALNEALKSEGDVQWRASICFSLIFLTLNIRFINGNYDHIRSPKWSDRSLGTTAFAYVLDVLAIILMHAILVVMAGRCFVGSNGVTIGQVPRDVNFYCPGFFACVVLLLVVDVAWLGYKGLVHFTWRRTSKVECKWQWLTTAIQWLPQQLAGAFGGHVLRWFLINSVSLVVIGGALLTTRNQKGLQGKLLPLPEQFVSDIVYITAGIPGAGVPWLYILTVLAVLAAMYDIGSTSVGDKARRNLEYLAKLSDLFKEAAKVAAVAQNDFRVNSQVANYSYAGKFPCGWMTEVDSKFSTLLPSAGGKHPQGHAIAQEFDRYSVQNANTLKSCRKLVIFCMLKPKNSDLLAIKVALAKIWEAEPPRKKPATVVCCWLREFHTEVRDQELSQVEGISLLEISLYESLSEDELVKETQEAMEMVDAAISELKASDAWRTI